MLRLYELEVALLSGPMTSAFIKKNPAVLRTIQIRSDQTLEDLHYAIFDAFGRDDEHLYEFQIGGEGPMDPNAKRYVTPMAGTGFDETTLGLLGLKLEESFGYWFLTSAMTGGTR